MPHTHRISVIGLGYVGFPVPVAFGRTGTPVVAFDINPGLIRGLRDGHDRIGKVDPEALRDASLRLTADPAECAHEYGLTLPPADAVVLAVSHREFRVSGWPLVAGLLKGGRRLAVDVWAMLDRATAPHGVQLWRL